MRRFSSLTCLSVLCLAFLGCSHSSWWSRSPANAEDPFVWLEEIEGEKAIEWVKERNTQALSRLKGDWFGRVEPELRKMYLAEDRMPGVDIMGPSLFNFWQDKVHVRGIWRRTTMDSYRTSNPVWETILDLDAISKAEDENWVWKDVDCLPPEYRRCMVSLSRGGKDATVYREFDVEKKSFVADGFRLEEAKSFLAWKDHDHLFMSTDLGEGSLSRSGYPIVVKLWERGTRLSSAPEVIRGEHNDMYLYPSVIHRPVGSYALINRKPSRFENVAHLVNEQGKTTQVPMPRDAEVAGIFKERILLQLRSELKAGNKAFPGGSLVAMPLASLGKGEGAYADLSAVFVPSKKRIFSSAATTKDHLILTLLDNVKGRLFRAEPKQDGSWELSPIAFGGNGMAGVSSYETLSNELLLSYADFLTPSSIYQFSAGQSGSKPRLLKQAPARFRSEGLVSAQYEAVSKDGARVPYFIVHKKDMTRDGRNPTLLYGYGGFQHTQTPFYSGTIGKVWLEKGGVYVHSNIRGGGEFGPAWHSAAQKENRQKSYDDFIAIAEDLIRRKITSPRHLGIHGASNGGLLVAAVMAQKPGLFNAVVSEVPLLDMLRFHKLLAGANWIGEYGSPEVPEERAYIEKYSPYQNIRAEGKYPEAYFHTNTKDDRVHPGHARKMVAKLLSMNHPVLYYENIEGGHAGGANLEQAIFTRALMFSYLWQKLAPEPKGK
jgi:prolyl oligopeptidase